jgi:serine protease inhibitor ecotin
MLNADGVEDEKVGQQYLERHNNWPAQMWIQTSYNTAGNQHKLGGTPLRGNYAGIGYTWDEDDQIFWPKKTFASWVKNKAEARWQSPIGDAPALTAEQTSQNEAGTHRWHYAWNESGQSWDLTDLKA